MSTIGNISGPSAIAQPVLPVVTPQASPSAASTTALTPLGSVEERLAAALIEIGGPASSVGLVGLLRPSSPGDVAVLLAQVSLTLEDTSDEAKANRAKLALNAIAQALRLLDPLAIDELRRTEFASKGEAEKLGSDIEAARGGPAARIAVLSALTDPAQIAAAAPELSALKAQIVSIAVDALDRTAALLTKEIGRLPAGDRRTVVEGQLDATNARRASLSGSDAYALAVSALSANASLLSGRVQTYGAASVEAAAALEQSLMAITSLVASVSASISANGSNEAVENSGRSTAIDALLSSILKTSARADTAFAAQVSSPQAEGRLDEKTARNSEAMHAGIAQLVQSLLSAAADLASALSRLDPLTISEPGLEPGRSRVRLDV
ncbi:MAG: hypothetical protein ACOH2J_16625 [Allorhizobium sp.]